MVNAIDLHPVNPHSTRTCTRMRHWQCLKWSKKEAGSLPQSEVEFPSAEIFLSENGEFWCILSGILCDLELQESKQETRYRPGKLKGARSPTRATRPHFKPWALVAAGRASSQICSSSPVEVLHISADPSEPLNKTVSDIKLRCYIVFHCSMQSVKCVHS